MKKSSIYLPEALKEALAEAARRVGRSEADCIRAAIETAVDQSRVGNRSTMLRFMSSSTSTEPRSWSS